MKKKINDKHIAIKGSSISKILKQLDANELKILVLITAYCDEFGVSRISQRSIVRETGISLPTVNKTVNTLIEKKIDNKHVIKREVDKASMRKNSSVYTINEDFIKICLF